MKKTIILLTIVSLFSCKKEEISSLSEVIRVRHANADMPAYIYGNASEKTFIIILHGGPGDSGFSYRAGTAAKELEKNYAMVYWDQRGQGLSEGKFSPEDVTIDLMVEDLNALILVLQHKYGSDIKIFLLGHSWGGCFGTAFLLKNDYQNKIKGWIEVDGAHDIPEMNVELTKMFLDLGNEQINLGNSTEKWQNIVSYAEQVDTNNIDNEIGRELNRKAHEVERYLVDDQIIKKADAKTMRDMSVFYHGNVISRIISGNYTYVSNDNFYNEVENASYTSQLHHITIPCLFLWGKYDFIIPPALAYDAYNMVNTTEKKLIIFDKSAHSPMLNQADEFVEAVEEFVDAYR